MKTLAKFALGALMLAGTTATLSEPASAHVSVGIGIGIPGPVYGPAYYGPRRVCNPYSPWYDPYYCGYDAYYDGPVFIGGVWYHGGPLRWRYWGGHRQFWWHGGWHTGRGWRPEAFHHGGSRAGFHPGSHTGFRGHFGPGGGFHGHPVTHSGFHGHIGTHSGGHSHPGSHR